MKQSEKHKVLYAIGLCIGYLSIAALLYWFLFFSQTNYFLTISRDFSEFEQYYDNYEIEELKYEVTDSDDNSIVDTRTTDEKEFEVAIKIRPFSKKTYEIRQVAGPNKNKEYDDSVFYVTVQSGIKFAKIKSIIYCNGTLQNSVCFQDKIVSRLGYIDIPVTNNVLGCTDDIEFELIENNIAIDKITVKNGETNDFLIEIDDSYECGKKEFVVKNTATKEEKTVVVKIEKKGKSFDVEAEEVIFDEVVNFVPINVYIPIENGIYEVVMEKSPENVDIQTQTNEVTNGMLTFSLNNVGDYIFTAQSDEREYDVTVTVWNEKARLKYDYTITNEER